MILSLIIMIQFTLLLSRHSNSNSTLHLERNYRAASLYSSNKR